MEQTAVKNSGPDSAISLGYQPVGFLRAYCFVSVTLAGSLLMILLASITHLGR